MEENGAWEEFRGDWLSPNASGSGPEVWSHWSKSFVSELSYAKHVESVIAIGSILAISLHDLTGAGKFPSLTL
jgi:dethiobiotin synthetase/adenosylmethionine--8-amino-7-oxononanoate aminotransferase